MLESLNGIGIIRKTLINVVGIRNVLGLLHFLRASITLSQNLLSGNDVLLKHLNKEDLVDFDVMCRHALVQEAWREHHVVAVEPELNTVLRVESRSLSGTLHSASGNDGSSAPEVDVETAVVDGSVAIGEEPRSNGAHDTPGAEAAHPNVVDHSEGSVESVRSILSLADLNGLEHSAEEARSLGHHVVDEVLQAAAIGQEPGLESVRHFIFDF